MEEIETNREAERLTQEIQKMSIKYDDFDDMKTLEYMRDNGITSIPLAYQQMGGELDFEDGLTEKLYKTKDNVFATVTRDNFREQLQNALYENNPEMFPQEPEEPQEIPTNENIGELLLKTLRGGRENG